MSDTILPPSFGPADLISGRYRVEKLLGAGGMGKVYQVWDLELSISVALKTILLQPGSKRRQVAHLKREALLARAVTHPHVCRVYDIGRDGEGDDATWFLTMELLRGVTLRERLSDRGRLTKEEALPLISQMASALEAAHRSGVIHRDFKCGNVMLVPDETGDRVVVTDFGIAREVLATAKDTTEGEETRWVSTEGVVGTPAYMAPEQVLGSNVSAQTDIYAFGIVVFEMVTGRLPFSGGTPMELAVRRITEKPASAKSLVPEIGDHWDAVIAKCLSREPSQRFETAGRVVDALVGRLDLGATGTTWSMTSVQLRGATEGSGAAGDSIPNNLPAQISKFVGRQDARLKTSELLDRGHLVTITGFGGIGKTRLAIEVARDRLHDFPDGVWLIELAPLTDPALVPQTVATAMGLKESSQRPWTDIIAEHLRQRTSLLILDNSDHMLGACADLVRTLLRSCTRLRILITSREALKISGETLYQLSNLDVPARDTVAPDELARFEAAELFIDRARSVHPGFTVTPEIVPAIVDICRRLDGIPLALELAAARVRSMPIHLISQRLDQRFRLLSSGNRAELPHHQTLRALIDWSYEQLDGHEQAMLRYLGTFAGGWSLEAAETVCTAMGIETWDVLDLLSHLVDKSLVEIDRSDRGLASLRYYLLETVRQYSRELLAAGSEQETATAAHRDFFISLAEDSHESLLGPEQGRWLAVLEAELDNIRLALATCKIRSDYYDQGLQLVGALTPFWHLHGYWSEGRRQSEEFLGLAEPSRTVIRARALKCAGQLAAAQGDYSHARLRLEEALAIFLELGESGGAAWSAIELGDMALHQKAYDRARSLFEENLASFRALSDQRGVAVSLRNLGVIAVAQGDLALARSRYEESLETQRKIGNKLGIANVLNNLGSVARDQRDLELAGRRYSESLTMQRELGNRFGIAVALNNLGVVSLELGMLADARSHYEESLGVLKELGHRAGVAQVLHNLGDVAHAQRAHQEAERFYRESAAVRIELGDHLGGISSLACLCSLAVDQQQWHRAALLLGAIQKHRQTIERPPSDEERQQREKAESALQQNMAPEELETLLRSGAAMTLEEVVAESLSGEES